MSWSGANWGFQSSNTLVLILSLNYLFSKLYTCMCEYVIQICVYKCFICSLICIYNTKQIYHYSPE